MVTAMMTMPKLTVNKRQSLSSMTALFHGDEDEDAVVDDRSDQHSYQANRNDHKNIKGCVIVVRFTNAQADKSKAQRTPRFACAFFQRLAKLYRC